MNRRALLGLAASTTAVPFACGTTLLHANNTNAQVGGPMTNPAPTPGLFRPLGLDMDHSAFPTAAILPDGDLRLMWRHGSAHISDDGEILTSLSSDQGVTWSAPQHVAVDNGPASPDPHLGPSGLSAVEDTVWVTYFVWANGVPSGARAARSLDGGATFEPSVRIDPGYPWAAISAPIIKVGTKLWTAFYARQPGEKVESAYAAWSTDDGTTWSTVRIAIGTAGNPFQEPWAVAGANSSVVFVMRDGNWRSLATRSISSAGVWSSTTRNVIANATGSSASVRASNGRIYLVYRDTVTRAAKLASSGNNGITWSVERELMPRPAGATSTVGMTYAHPIQVGNGLIFCPLGMERSNSTSNIYVGWL